QLEVRAVVGSGDVRPGAAGEGEAGGDVPGGAVEVAGVNRQRRRGGRVVIEADHVVDLQPAGVDVAEDRRVLELVSIGLDPRLGSPVRQQRKRRTRDVAG